MSVHIEHVGEVAVVVAEGMFTGGKETLELEASLRALIENKERRKILLNLSGTRLMLSVAIGALVAAHVRATEHGVTFYVCGIRPALKKVFETFQIQSQVLNDFESCEEALQALQEL